ncbi:MAG: hypothetical protein CVU39_14435 [Chloroflexi bacterium HGW-Chloroflexi-10]|nr:MAG: hypothetical protein CVU39_14435 [Chloroflexi bacterium HGW-Chloroflexi-10]
MSLAFTILGFLNLGEMTGYELKKAIDSSTQAFWHAELSQIYPTLKRLEQKGWASVQTIPQNGKPDKKLYAITGNGQQVLMDWLREPLDETPAVKSPILLKLFFMGELECEELLAQLHFQLEIQRARLKRYQQESKQIIRNVSEAEDMKQNGMLWELVRQYGELQAQTSIQWLEGAIEKIEAENENHRD